MYWKFPIPIQQSVKIWSAANTQSRVLQADQLILENNEKATLNTNMPRCTCYDSSMRTDIELNAREIRDIIVDHFSQISSLIHDIIQC